MRLHSVEKMDIAASDEHRMSACLRDYVSAQIADGVAPLAMEIALEEALKHLKLLKELGNVAAKR